MELRHLRYFIAVAEELHFGRAAERLRITQPPLSYQIQSLERELGVQLFVRGRTVELTEAGTAFLDKARWALQAADDAARAAQSARTAPAGRLRVGYPAMTAGALAPEAMRRFAARFPSIEVEPVAGHSGAHLRALEAEQLDVAFVCGGAPDCRAARFRPVEAEPLLLAIPDGHQLTRSAMVRVEQLAGEPMVLFPRASEPALHWYLVTDVLGGARVAPLVAMEAPSVESTCSAVAAGIGIAFVLASTAAVLRVPGVTYRPIAPPSPVLRHGVAWRPDGAIHAVRGFLEIVDELSARVPGTVRRRRPVAEVAAAD
jgi:DNA-binding transcriptional LysR family regulator